jgi:hypothetical protein
VPAVIPLTIPVLLTLAIALLELLQVPPDTELLRVVVFPVHTKAVPVVAAAPALTVSTWVAAVPQPVLYVILVVPALTVAIEPLLELIVATLELLLLHVPKGTVLL